MKRIFRFLKYLKKLLMHQKYLWKIKGTSQSVKPVPFTKEPIPLLRKATSPITVYWMFAIRAVSVLRATDLVDNFIALEPGELFGAVDYRVGVQLDADVLGQLIHI